jgi:hypothetical protein
VGLSPVSVAGHCAQVKPRSTRRAAVRNRISDRRRIRSRASAGTGASPHLQAKKRLPSNHPHLAPSPPLIAERRWRRTPPPLRPPKGGLIGPGEFERGFPNRYGPARVGLDFIRNPPSEIAPFQRLSQQHLRLTRQPRASAARPWVGNGTIRRGLKGRHSCEWCPFRARQWLRAGTPGCARFACDPGLSSRTPLGCIRFEITTTIPNVVALRRHIDWPSFPEFQEIPQISSVAANHAYVINGKLPDIATTISHKHGAGNRTA